MKLRTALELIGSMTLFTLSLILLVHLNGLPDRQRYWAVVVALFTGLTCCLLWFTLTVSKVIVGE